LEDEKKIKKLENFPDLPKHLFIKKNNEYQDYTVKKLKTIARENGYSIPKKFRKTDILSLLLKNNLI